MVQNKDVQNITVFGAGLMGAGIAQVLAHKGKFNVTLSDVTDKALANGQTIISKSLGRIAKKAMAEASAEEQAKFVKGIVDSIKVTTDPEAAVKDTDLVIEAIIENVGIKKDLFWLPRRQGAQGCALRLQHQLSLHHRRRRGSLGTEAGAFRRCVARGPLDSTRFSSTS